ncbi:MAG: methyltransferase domain-containing protein [bacterium]|nr:methyltransferase domain-containing protein [bacterium]
MTTEYRTQVNDAGKYKSEGYLSARRWSSYAIQVREAMLAKPGSILEVGPGNGVVTGILRSLGFKVETLDVDERLGTNHVGSITDEETVKSLAGKFDLIMACQIFEHIKYEDFLKALRLIRRVAPRAVISLPHTELHSRFFYLNLKMPIISNFTFAKKIIYKTVDHVFNGEHYWEMGKRGYPTGKVARDIKASGWCIEKSFFNPDNPFHYFFVLSNENKH